MLVLCLLVRRRTRCVAVGLRVANLHAERLKTLAPFGSTLAHVIMANREHGPTRRFMLMSLGCACFT